MTSASSSPQLAYNLCPPICRRPSLRRCLEAHLPRHLHTACRREAIVVTNRLSVVLAIRALRVLAQSLIHTAWMVPVDCTSQPRGVTGTNVSPAAALKLSPTSTHDSIWYVSATQVNQHTRPCPTCECHASSLTSVRLSRSLARRQSRTLQLSNGPRLTKTTNILFAGTAVATVARSLSVAACSLQPAIPRSRYARPSAMIRSIFRDVFRTCLCRSSNLILSRIE